MMMAVVIIIIIIIIIIINIIIINSFLTSFSYLFYVIILFLLQKINNVYRFFSVFSISYPLPAITDTFRSLKYAILNYSMIQFH